MIEHVRGVAAIPAWDQAHADAMNALRQCEAFVLVTVKDAELRFRAMSRDLSEDAMIELLVRTHGQAAESALEMARGE